MVQPALKKRARAMGSTFLQNSTTPPTSMSMHHNRKESARLPRDGNRTAGDPLYPPKTLLRARENNSTVMPPTNSVNIHQPVPPKYLPTLEYTSAPAFAKMDDERPSTPQLATPSLERNVPRSIQPVKAGSKIKIYCTMSETYRLATVLDEEDETTKAQMIEYDDDGTSEVLVLAKNKFRLLPKDSSSDMFLFEEESVQSSSEGSVSTHESAETSSCDYSNNSHNKVSSASYYSHNNNLPSGKQISVLWQDNYKYAATILASYENFYLIHYEDGEIEWIDLMEHEIELHDCEEEDSASGWKLDAEEQGQDSVFLPKDSRISVWWPFSNAYFEATVIAAVSTHEGDLYNVSLGNGQSDTDMEPELLDLAMYHYKILSVPSSGKSSLPTSLQQVVGWCPVLDPGTLVSVWFCELRCFEQGKVVECVEGSHYKVEFEAGHVRDLNLSQTKFKILSTPRAPLRYRPQVWTMDC